MLEQERGEVCVGNEVATHHDTVGRPAIGLPEAVQLAQGPNVGPGEQRLDVGLGFFWRERTLEDRRMPVAIRFQVTLDI